MLCETLGGPVPQSLRGRSESEGERERAGAGEQVG